MLGGINSPGTLVGFLQAFAASAEITTWVDKVSYKYVADQYVNKDSICSSTFQSSGSFLTNRSGSCYDLAMFSANILRLLGYECDMLNFGWISDIKTVHAACRFWHNDEWYIVHGFLNGRITSIEGSFFSIKDFIEKFAVMEKEETGKDIKMIFIDSFGFEKFGEPTSLTRLYPSKQETVKLGYWEL
jgi:hypothetical protein